MNANLLPVFMELAQIYLMITNVHVIQDLLGEIVQYYQHQAPAIHILASMELHVLKMLMVPVPAFVVLVTLAHSVKLTSTSV